MPAPHQAANRALSGGGASTTSPKASAAPSSTGVPSLDLSSLEALNKQFWGWVEDEYHQREHSSLGTKPLDRLALDMRRIRFLSPGAVSDGLFFVEQERSVPADNAFSLKNIRFEAPRDLRGRKVQIRFDRLKFDRAIVYFKGERMGEARPVDFVANDRKPVRKTKTPPRESYDVSEVER